MSTRTTASPRQKRAATTSRGGGSAIADDEASPVGPRTDMRRMRVNFPRADVSTSEWLDVQENVSRSLQLLIRDSIMRDGFVDVVNRPVAPLPRRGRPPLNEQSLREHGEADEPGPADVHGVTAGAAGPDEDREDLAPDAYVESEEALVPAESFEHSDARPEPAAVAEPSAPRAVSRAVASSSGQVDIDDIFGHNG